MTTVMAATPDEKPKKKGGIAFNESVEVYKVVPRRSMYSADEKAATWTEKSEYKKFKDDCKQVLRKLETGRRVSDAHNSALGLSHLTKDGKMVRQKKRMEVWDAVLDAQEMQWNAGRRDSSIIAAAARHISEESQSDAQLKAQRILLDIQDYATMDDIDIKKSSAAPKRAMRRTSSMNDMKAKEFMNGFKDGLAAMQDSFSSLASFDEDEDEK